MSSLIVWSEGYSVGNEEIDSQHKRLIDLINKLYVLYLNKNESEISDVIKEIKDYTLYHFSSEEKYFRDNNYHNARTHIGLHEKFIDDLNKLIKEYNSMPSVLVMRILTFLQNWLTNHILKEDKKYVGYL